MPIGRDSSLPLLLFPDAAIREFALRVAARSLERQLARPLLLGRHDHLQTAAGLLGISIRGALVVDPVEDEEQGGVIRHFLGSEAGRGLTPDVARAILLADRCLYGACLVGVGRANRMVLVGGAGESGRQYEFLAGGPSLVLPPGLEERFRARRDAPEGGLVVEEAAVWIRESALRSPLGESSRELRNGSK